MKVMKRGLVFLLLVGVILLSGTAGAVTVAKDGVITMKLAHVSPLGSPSDLTAIRLKDLLKERTNGKIVIEIFPNEQLGIEKAAFQGVVVGTIDLSMNDAAYVADLFSPMGVLDFPYMYRNWEHYEGMLTSKVHQDLVEAAYKKLGAKFPAAFLFGRRMLCSNKPVRSLADTKGLKIRTPGNELAMENARVLGGVPTTIAYSEAYMGLKQGVADAAENPTTGIWDMKWHEVTKYLVITEHVWNNEVLSMSKKAWAAMTPAQQKIFNDTCVEVEKYRVALQKDLEGKRLEDLKKFGMEVIEPPSLDPFRQLAQEISKKYRERYKADNWGEWYDKVKNIKK
jgi:tripartite ATP-independent transporter DctP family solute receptor